MSFVEWLGKVNDSFWKNWESGWSKMYELHNSNCKRFEPVWNSICVWDKKNCEKIMSLFPKQHYCGGCCDPSHWHEYKNGLPSTIKKFDHSWSQLYEWQRS